MKTLLYALGAVAVVYLAVAALGGLGLPWVLAGVVAVILVAVGTRRGLRQ